MRSARFVPVVALALTLGGAVAASGPRVALVVVGPLDQDAMQLEARLRAELLVSGFEVLTVQREQQAGSSDLARIAGESGAGAAVSIVRSDRWLSAEVWLSRSRAGTAVLQQVRPEPVSHDAPAIVAIRAAEILRASAIDLRSPTSPAPAASADPTPPSAAPVAVRAAPPSPPQRSSAPVDRGPTPVPARPRLLSITAALSAVGGPGGVPGGFGPTLGLSSWFADAWAAEVRATGPVASSVAFDQGSADVDREIVVADVRLDIDAAEQLTPFVLIGGGVLRTGVQGKVTTPALAERDSAWTAVALVETGLRVQASRAWAVRSELGAFCTASRHVVAVDDRIVASHGRPGFLGSLGLELGW